MVFSDRQQAGTLLAEKLASFRGQNALVVGLARGGVVVAGKIAHELSLPLDVLVVKKISDPFDSELALGAMAPDGVMVVDWRLAHRVGADEDYIKKQTPRLAEQIKQKTILYRKGKKPLAVKERIVVLVDDGVATGATLEAAIKWLRKKKAKKIVAAVPVAPPEVVSRVRPETDELIVLEMPDNLNAVGQFYKHFPQATDDEVVELLR